MAVVFKAKFEETLRRFTVDTVSVDGKSRLDLNMEGLRLKIRSLFNLPLDVDFSLTYRDEDDDIVTLVDDEDLHDVLKQGIDPVRVTVHLSSDKTDHAASNGSSAASRSPLPSPQFNISQNVAEVLKSVQEPLRNVLLNIGSSSQSSQQNIKPDFAEVFKSVQEPLSLALSKLSLENLEMASKAAASASPALADVYEGLSKMGQALNASHSQFGTGNLGRNDDVCNGSKLNSKPEPSVNEGTRHEGVHTSGPVQPAPESTPAAKGPLFNGFARVPSSLLDRGKIAICEPVPNNFHTSDNVKKNKKVMEQSVETYDFMCNPSKVRMSEPTGMESKKVTAQEQPSWWKSSIRGYETFPMVECPFSGVPVLPATGAQALLQEEQYKIRSSVRSSIKPDGMGSVFHRGVQCDNCGVLPITGPRFKSKVKHDYDLCSICFSQVGNLTDYSRIDFPLSYVHPWSYKGFPAVVTGPRPMHAPYMTRLHAGKHHRSRLDSRFIMDVNITDGTTMAPSTPFTKIWRMRNNGPLPWPPGLRLLWIGGDRFSPSELVELEIPISGVNVGNELDIAVDFIAPELPGRYISYWRMSDASGHKFGQRVWVLIQVDPSVDLTRESSPVLNLNLPPESSGLSGPQLTDENAEPALNVAAGDPSAPSIVEKNCKIEMEDLNFPINDDLLVATYMMRPSSAAASSVIPPAPGADAPPSPPAASFISYPNIDTDAYNMPKASAPLASPPVGSYANAYNMSSASGPLTPYHVSDMLGESSASSSNVKGSKSNLDGSNLENTFKKEEILLKELAQMGFKQVDLNKEVLRMNEYDLERSVDELCGVSEWDPILDELKEMGFQDKETNKKLLAKNNGSLTRVVMDLIAGEEA